MTRVATRDGGSEPILQANRSPSRSTYALDTELQFGNAHPTLRQARHRTLRDVAERAGGGTGAEPYTHDSDEEVVVVLSGILDLSVGDEHDVLREGDAITFPSRLPHWDANHGEEPARVIFCLTPPSF